MALRTGGEAPNLDMPKVSCGHGLGLVALAAVMAAITGPSSLATLVPALFGVVLVGLGALALARPDARKHAMHAVAAAALLGLIGTIRPAIDVAASVAGRTLESPSGDSYTGLTAPVLASLLWLCVRSFRQARRAR